MKINTLIEHKEAIVVCEESETVNMSYNILLTTSKASDGFKPIILVVIAKLTLIYTNCIKISHLT